MIVKRGAFLLLIFILLASSSLALTITPNTPADSITLTTTRNVTFGCTATGNITSLELYHDTSGSFILEQTNNSGVTSGAEFIFNEETNIADGTYTWGCRASNSSTSLFSSNFTFTIAISGSNTAPTYTNIPNITWAEDTVDTSLNLGTYFTDDESLVYFALGNSNINITIDNTTGIVTLTPLPDWTGAETVTFTADDGSLTNTSNSVLLNVTPVDDPPTLKKDIPNQTWTINNDLTIDLSNYFEDIDSTLEYSVSNLNNNIDYTINGDIITLTPAQDYTGVDDDVIFKASDNLTTINSNQVRLEVTEGNIAPTINSNYPEENPKMNLSERLKFNISASDANGDSLSYQWYVDGGAISGATSSSFTYTPLSPGAHKVEVVVTDGALTTSYEWTVTVLGDIGEVIEAPSPLCGNGEVDAGEGCITCPSDVICNEEEQCIQNKCTLIKETSNSLIIIIVIVILVIAAGAAFFFYYKNRKDYGFDEPEPLMAAKQIKSRSGEEPPTDIDDVYFQRKKEVKKESKKTVAKVMLRNYIRDSRAKKVSFGEIKRHLIKKGWDKKLVDKEIKKQQKKK